MKEWKNKMLLETGNKEIKIWEKRNENQSKLVTISKTIEESNNRREI